SPINAKVSPVNEVCDRARDIRNEVRHVVHDVVQLLILGLEELMEIIELNADNSPVIVSRPRVEQVFIGQYAGQQLHDAVSIFVGNAKVRFHRFTPSSSYAR